MYKRILQLSTVIIALVGILFATSANAVTVTGTDIKVDYIGTAGPTDLTYRVTVVIYTQCDNSGTIGLRPSINVEVSSMKHNLKMDLPMKRLDPMVGDTISPYCNNVRTSCNDPSLMNTRPGFMRTTYTAVISLPFQTDDWIFYYWHPGNGRRNTSMNLCDQMTTHVAALCSFNNLDKYDNSSPRFTSNPVKYLVVNSPETIYNEAVDPDLDSIVTTPYQSLGCIMVNGAICQGCGFYSEVDYVPGAGYSVNSPIITSPPNTYYVNPTTGNASFTTFNGGSYAFSFKCEEFDRRTGKSLGYVIRDVAMPINYFTGGNFTLDSLPSNLNGAIFAPQGSKSIVTCPGSTITFNIGAQSASGNLYLSASTDPAIGSNFTVTGNGTPNTNGSFSWTPGIGDTGSYVVLIRAVDSACNNVSYPMAHRKYTAVTIHVVSGIDAGPDKSHCVLDEPVMIAPDKVIPGLAYNWTDILGGPAKNIDNPNIPAPRVSPTHTSSYVVSVKGLPPTCKSSDTVTVHVDTLNSVKITPESPVVLCDEDFLELDANAFGPPPFKNLTCGLTGEAENTPLETINVVPLNGTLQSGGNTQSTPFSSSATSRHQYLIRSSDLMASNMRSGTLTGLTLFAAANNFSTTFHNFRVHLKCTENTALDANAFTSGAVAVFAASRFTVPASGRIDIDFDAWYDWDTTQNLIVEICFTDRDGITPQFTDYYSTFYTSCIYTNNASGNSVCGGGVGSTGPDAVQELPRMEFRYHPVTEAEFQYSWLRLMGNYVSDTASKNPSIEIDQRTKYYVETYGRSGCLLRDSLDVFLSERDFKIQPMDTLICRGDTAMITTSGGAYFKWYEDDFSPVRDLNCDNCEEVKAWPREDKTYKVIISDSFQCADTLESKVAVMASSDVRILNNDTTIRYGQSVQLEATGAEQYVWSPTNYLDNPGSPNPVSTPTESITYVVTGSSSGLCKSYDTIRINVSLRDPIAIPSAFSPNGDGINDVFKIENLSFQKVVEFRVFNRLGQEVFNGFAEGKNEWDGTWKQKPVPMGVYFYQITLAYPDGFNERHTGDVTLIR